MGDQGMLLSSGRAFKECCYLAALGVITATTLDKQLLMSCMSCVSTGGDTDSRALESETSCQCKDNKFTTVPLHITFLKTQLLCKKLINTINGANKMIQNKFLLLKLSSNWN